MEIQTKPRRTYKKEKKRKIAQFDPEDEANDSFNIEERPPCRQNTNLFDLDYTFYPVFSIQKASGFLKDSSRGIRADIRPPSRHKTPPKALGLELPPKMVYSEYKSNDLRGQDSPINSIENESLSNTMPANFGMTEKKWAQGERRMKPQSAKGGKKSEKIPVRIWSAGKSKQIEVPIVLNKREKKFLNVKNPRRENWDDLQNEENKKLKSFKKKNLETGQNKSKGAQIVGFQTNLEPEFLSLFAKSEDFNF